MDIRKRKLRGIFVLSVLIILCLCTASVLSFFTPNKSAESIAVGNIDSQSTNLGEMLLDGYENDTSGKAFNAKVFLSLISQISGVKNPNKDTIDNLTTIKTSADFRTNNKNLGNGEKDIVVTIGGKKWIATYLSTNTSGDPILTLWLANSATKIRWNTKSVNSLGKYPNNMYGTSEVRAKTLNNGGGYAVNYNDTELTEVTQDESSELAIYTMPNVKGSLTSFIEVPDNMSWQHNQSAKTSTGEAYDYNNDALDVGGSYDEAFNYLTNPKVDKTGYKGWANDRLWLPSVAETGLSGVDGIWKTIESTRANSTYTFLRSAYYSLYYDAYMLNAAGAKSNGRVTTAYSIRPAFHLNLKNAADKTEYIVKEPSSRITTVYTGNQLSLDDVPTEQKTWYDSSTMDLEYPTEGMADAGTHKVKVVVKPNLQSLGVKFMGTPDTSKGETEYIRYFDFVITQKTLRANFDTSVSPPKVKAVLED